MQQRAKTQVVAAARTQKLSPVGSVELNGGAGHLTVALRNQRTTTLTL